MSIDIQPQAQPVEPATTVPSLPVASKPRAQSRSGWKRGALAVTLLAVLAISTVAVMRTIAPAPSTRVLTHQIQRGNLIVSVTEQGTLESSNNREIKCNVKGGSTVLSVVETGTVVKPGDELVRLDQSTIEDNISSQQILYENALANKTTTEADVEVAQIAITEYLEGTYQQERKTIENEIYVAEQDLKTAQLSYNSIKRSVSRGLVSSLQLQGEQYRVNAAQNALELSQKKLDVLDNYTKAKEMKTLRATLKAAEARLASDTEALKLEEARLKRAKDQLANCVILAEAEGMVIYPSAAEWKEQPDIEEGASVREDQVLLIMPDLKQMQVKVGIHESKVDRVSVGMDARVELQDSFVDGEVASIASITKPTGWWNGNVVKYDTVIKVDAQGRLKPGMSVAVEVFLARYNDVLTIPVAAVVEQDRKYLCWVQTDDGFEERPLKLGDSNDQFIVVEDGVEEGELVVLNPIDFVDEAKSDALRPMGEGTAPSADQAADTVKDAGAKGSDDVAPGKKPGVGVKKKTQSPKPKQANKRPQSGADIIKLADKNGDGVLEKDEFEERTRPYFDAIDTDQNGKVDAAEIEAGMKRMRDAAKTPEAR